MKGKKLGSLFLISILALAGIGVSYAGLTETVLVHGSVNNARVEFENFEFTGTWVYKVWDCEGAPSDEMVVTNDPDYDPSINYPGCKSELVSYAYTYPAGDGDNYDVGVIYDNLMPGVDYVADLHFNIGTIPVIVEHLDYGIIDSGAWDWVTPLVDSGDIWGTMYTSTGKIVELGTQIHANERVNLELHINIPQNNIYQGVEGSFYLDMSIVQWTDPCDPELKYGNITVEKLTVEDPTDPDAEFNFTITNTSGYSQNFVLESDEEISFNYLGLGTYTITETDVPSADWSLINIGIGGFGYQNNVTTVDSITFDLLDQGEVEVNFTNEEDTNLYEKPELVLPSSMNLSFIFDGLDDCFWDLIINSIDGTGVWSQPIGVGNTLRGWCVDEETSAYQGYHDVTVVPYDDRETTRPGHDDNTPDGTGGITPWDCVDYIINLHRLNDYYPMSVQIAIWHYVNGGHDPSYYDGEYNSTIIDEAETIIDAVNDNAVDWVNNGRQPMTDVLWLGIILIPTDGQQITIIEIDP